MFLFEAGPVDRCLLRAGQSVLEPYVRSRETPLILLGARPNLHTLRKDVPHREIARGKSCLPREAIQTFDVRFQEQGRCQVQLCS